jgi:hypothetical protein
MKTVKDAYEYFNGVWPSLAQNNLSIIGTIWVHTTSKEFSTVCTKQQFIDYGNSLKEKEMKGKTVVFQGYELEVGKWYKANTFEAIFKGLSGDGWASFECSALKFICKDIERIKELDAGKITKAKIIPEEGKVYKCKTCGGEKIKYLKGEGIKNLSYEVEIICEMVEKQ